MERTYSDIFADHLRRPRNVGEIDGADGVSVVRDRSCGDLLRLTLRIRDDRIEEARFRAFGCGATVASSSMLTILLEGMSVEEVLAMGVGDVSRALQGLPMHRMHSSRLAGRAAVEAMEDHLRRRGG